MSRFIKKQGFTLIELMVVIVIIGVLASLAIPRFTEASSKAKIAEAPRVLASYESAYLAAIAETATPTAISSGDLIFETPKDSKWFGYAINGTGANTCVASASGKIGNFSGSLTTTYGSDDVFKHTSTQPTVANKMVPNFCGSGKCN
jgi:prepilin-type N-terminal cleavage/methylation domain-containing protein